MPAVITSNIQDQLTMLSGQLSVAVSQAGEQVSAIEGHFEKFGDAYKNDPQAVDHLDILRNNISSLSSNATLLGLFANNPQGSKAEQIIQQLGKIAGWKHRDSHIPADDGRPHAPPPPQQTRESATREMTSYIGAMIEKYAQTINSTDTDTLREDFKNLTKTVGIIYRHTETASRLESMISREGMTLGTSTQ